MNKIRQILANLVWRLHLWNQGLNFDRKFWKMMKKHKDIFDRLKDR